MLNCGQESHDFRLAEQLRPGGTGANYLSRHIGPTATSSRVVVRFIMAPGNVCSGAMDSSVVTTSEYCETSFQGQAHCAAPYHRWGCYRSGVYMSTTYIRVAFSVGWAYIVCVRFHKTHRYRALLPGSWEVSRREIIVWY